MGVGRVIARRSFHQVLEAGDGLLLPPFQVSPPGGLNVHQRVSRGTAYSGIALVYPIRAGDIPGHELRLRRLQQLGPVVLALLMVGFLVRLLGFVEPSGEEVHVTEGIARVRILRSDAGVALHRFDGTVEIATVYLCIPEHVRDLPVLRVQREGRPECIGGGLEPASVVFQTAETLENAGIRGAQARERPERIPPHGQVPRELRGKEIDAGAVVIGEQIGVGPRLVQNLRGSGTVAGDESRFGESQISFSEGRIGGDGTLKGCRSGRQILRGEPLSPGPDGGRVLRAEAADAVVTELPDYRVSERQNAGPGVAQSNRLVAAPVCRRVLLDSANAQPAAFDGEIPLNEPIGAGRCTLGNTAGTHGERVERCAHLGADYARDGGPGPIPRGIAREVLERQKRDALDRAALFAAACNRRQAQRSRGYEDRGALRAKQRTAVTQRALC